MYVWQRDGRADRIRLLRSCWRGCWLEPALEEQKLVGLVVLAGQVEEITRGRVLLLVQVEAREQGGRMPLGLGQAKV